MRRRLSVTLAVCAGLVLVSACGSTDQGKAGTFYGPPQNLGNGTAKTYVTVDTEGHPTALGIQLSAAALDRLPAHGAAVSTMVEFPEQASMTDFTHVMIDWNPDGHPPKGVFDKPHFDFHFYMTDMASVMAIDPRDPRYAERAAHLPDPRYVPAGYQPELGPPAVTAVPAMGLHWVDDANSLVPHRYNFTHVLINGSWDGKYTFIEPMITRDWLLTKPATIQEQLSQPTQFQRTGYFPTVHQVGYDGSADVYEISLGGMVMHQAS